MREFTITRADAGQRLDKYLRRILPEMPSGLLYKQLRKKNITLNDKKAEGGERLSEGDLVKCFFSEETFRSFAGEGTDSKAEQERRGLLREAREAYQSPVFTAVHILAETEDALVLGKPVGVLSQKAESGEASLNEFLIGYLLERGSITPESLRTFRPSVCNRLDRGTGGIVLCGKTLQGSQELTRMLRERELGKYYLAICAGEMTGHRDITARLSKDSAQNLVTVQDAGEGNASDASSLIRTEFFPLAVTQDRAYSLVEIRLHTGKSHQIRAQLQTLGTPILGDLKYGDARANERFRREFRSGRRMQGQLLYAWRVTFPEGNRLGLSRAAVRPPEPFGSIGRELFGQAWERLFDGM